MRQRYIKATDEQMRRVEASREVEIEENMKMDREMLARYADPRSISHASSPRFRGFQTMYGEGQGNSVQVRRNISRLVPGKKLLP